MGSPNRQYLAPAASEHSDACRVMLFNWRLRNAGLPAIDDVERFPCNCPPDAPARPWRLVPVDHPAWCVTEGQNHAWTACTITPMVPREET